MKIICWHGNSHLDDNFFQKGKGKKKKVKSKKKKEKSSDGCFFREKGENNEKKNLY